MTKPIAQKYLRTKLNNGQLDILELLYRYRFASRQIIGDALNLKSGSSLHTKLEVLCKYGYIAKRYDKSMRLLGMPAAYHMLPSGMRMLSTYPGHESIDDQAMHAIYKDKTVSDDFVVHTMDVHRNTLSLQSAYPSLKVFTKRDMAQYSYFPKQLPDAFLSLPNVDSKPPRRYFFDLVSDRQADYLIERKLKAYVDFFDEGGWDETGSGLPCILLLCEWEPAEKRIRRIANSVLQKSESEMQAYTTITAAVENHETSTAVWSPVADDERLSLELITGNH